jgi:inhibitor of KinA
VVAAGDSVLIVEFEERIDPAVNARTIACADAIQAAGISGVRDVVPTYRSVAIYFDPLRTESHALLECVEREARQPSRSASEGREAVRIPVCYGGELGPDLTRVVRRRASACRPARSGLPACRPACIPGKRPAAGS